MPFTNLLNELDAEEAIPDELEDEADEAAEEDVGAEDPGPSVPPSFEPVEDAEALQSISEDLSGDYQLVDDIDLSGENVDPLGSFEGSLNGDGFSITGINIDSEETNVGLFNSISSGGEVRNLTLEGEVTGGRTGILAGFLSGIVEDVVVEGSVDGEFRAGGIAGFVSSGTISRSGADVEVVSGAFPAGGLAGRVEDGAVVEESYAKGSVDGQGSLNHLGGLVGELAGVPDGDAVGERAEIRDSYSTADILSADFDGQGGLVGQNEGEQDGDTLEAGNVARSFAAGEVSDEQVFRTGGFVGHHFSNESPSDFYKDVYWDEDNTSQADGIGDEDDPTSLEGLETNEMQGQSATDNLEGLDFEDTWTTVSDDYPRLQWEDA